MIERVSVLELEDSALFPRLAPEMPPTLMIVSDDFHLTTAMEVICDFLGLGIEQIPTEGDAVRMARDFRPVAIMVSAEGEGQDGFHVMKGVAEIDPDMPIMLLTGDDPAMMGAADAIESLFGLTAVTKTPGLPSVGEIVDFLFRAGRRGGWFRAMQA